MKHLTLTLTEAMASGEFDVYIHFADCYGIRGPVAEEMPELAAHDADVTGLGDRNKLGHLAYTHRRDRSAVPATLVAAYVKLYWAGPSSNIVPGALEEALGRVKELFPGKRMLYALPEPASPSLLALIDRCLEGEDHTLLKEPS